MDMSRISRCGTSDIKKIKEKRLEWYRRKCEEEGRRIHAMKMYNRKDKVEEFSNPKLILLVKMMGKV